MSQEIKLLVLKICGSKCFNCGESLNESTAAVDKKTPSGPAEAVDNLVSACSNCVDRKVRQTFQGYRAWVRDNLGVNPRCSHIKWRLSYERGQRTETPVEYCDQQVANPNLFGDLYCAVHKQE